REDGAQIVADARQHLGPLLDLALDTLAHLDEGEARAPDLLGAARLEIGRRGPSLAETFSGVGQVENRPDLVAKEGDRYQEQHHRSADHPKKEDVRLRLIGLAALG